MALGLPHRSLPRMLPSQTLQSRVIPQRKSLPLRPVVSYNTRNVRWATVDAKQETRERILILGSGWAGFVLSRDLDEKKFQPLVVSPRSHFVFTPLLNEATAGTTEFRSILEPVRSKRQGVDFYQGWADSIDFDKKTVTVEESIFDPTVSGAHLAEKSAPTPKTKGQTFTVSYDKLIITVGAYCQTFGTKGVKENAMFLRDVTDGRKVRRRILELFEAAGLPIVSDDVRKCMLHFAIVGGGPTGMEFAAELRDLIHEDLAKIYPDLMKFVNITVFDVAPKVLPMFDENLASYAMSQFKREGVDIRTSHHIKQVRRGLPSHMDAQMALKHEEKKGGCYTIETEEEGEIGIGMCLWSTGNAANPLLEQCFGNSIRYPSKSAMMEEGNTPGLQSKSPSSDQKDTDPADREWKVSRDAKTGSLLVTDRFQVQLETTKTSSESKSDSSSTEKSESTTKAIMRDVYAMGDCAMLASGPLPGTAQVANQEAQWLAKALNKSNLDNETFHYKDLGVMTYIGGSRALMQGGKGKGKSPDEKGGRMETHTINLKGREAYLLWKGAYLSMTMSWKNRVLVWMYWIITKVFGRDITRF